MDEDPHGSADPAPLPAGAELGPKVGLRAVRGSRDVARPLRSEESPAPPVSRAAPWTPAAAASLFRGWDFDRGCPPPPCGGFGAVACVEVTAVAGGAAGTGRAAGAAGVAVAGEAAAVTGGNGGGIMGPSGGGVPARRGHRPSSPRWAITQW